MTQPGLVHGSELTSRIIALAMRVHTRLGPGLLENAYERCLCHEFEGNAVPYARQVELPIEYDDLRLDCGYRADIIVADTVILEIKSIDRILQIHEAQLLTYLRISKRRIGLLINFNTTSLKNGLRRCVL
jgi:GxxExxY protein